MWGAMFSKGAPGLYPEGRSHSTRSVGGRILTRGVGMGWFPAEATPIQYTSSYSSIALIAATPPAGARR